MIILAVDLIWGQEYERTLTIVRLTFRKLLTYILLYFLTTKRYALVYTDFIEREGE